MQDLRNPNATAIAQPARAAETSRTAPDTVSAPTAAAQHVLKQTYRLLGLTLAFSALTATASIALSLPHPGLILTLVGYFGLLALTAWQRNSVWGLVGVFALTGFMGLTMGPLLSAMLAQAPTAVALAFGTTAAVFFGLSAWARTGNAPDMLRFGNFLFVGILTAFCLGLAAIFMELPALALGVSGLFVLLMSGLILFETQNILRGGETNYIMATVTLFVSIYNLFTSLLHIFGFLSDE